MQEVIIRLATVSDIPTMQEIERQAGRLFARIGMDDVAAHEPASTVVMVAYVNGCRAWVAEVEGQAWGYALADLVDGNAHLEQLSVHPEFGRRGIGRALVERVVQWAREHRLERVTLITFRDVQWNAPYYARLGFRVLPDDYPGPELATLRRHEDGIGLDRAARCAMYLEVLG
jgi:GNAT superfamily N-acetyltransferase